MATLAKQSIPDYQKGQLESMAANAGESIATIVRDILRREFERQNDLPTNITIKNPLYPEV